MTTPALYNRVWKHPKYDRRANHGLDAWSYLVTAAAGYCDLMPAPGARMMDFGCGNGLLVAHWLEQGYDAYGVDFAEVAFSKSIVEKYPKRLVAADLRFPNSTSSIWDFGMCADVLEHLDEADVPGVLAMILSRCRQAYIQVGLKPDVSGPRTVRQPLHVTLIPASRWAEIIAEASNHDVLRCIVNNSGSAGFLISSSDANRAPAERR